MTKLTLVYWSLSRRLSASGIALLASSSAKTPRLARVSEGEGGPLKCPAPRKLTKVFTIFHTHQK